MSRGLCLAWYRKILNMQKLTFLFEDFSSSFCSLFSGTSLLPGIVREGVFNPLLLWNKLNFSCLAMLSQTCWAMFGWQQLLINCFVGKARMAYQKTHKCHVTSTDICLQHANWTQKRAGSWIYLLLKFKQKRY